MWVAIDLETSPRLAHWHQLQTIDVDVRRQSGNPEHGVGDVPGGQRMRTFAALSDLPESFQAIDVLINNAGLALSTASAPETNLDDWLRMIRTNVIGLVTLTHRLLPVLIERRGLIVNLSSVAGSYPYQRRNLSRLIAYGDGREKRRENVCTLRRAAKSNREIRGALFISGLALGQRLGR